MCFSTFSFDLVPKFPKFKYFSSFSLSYFFSAFPSLWILMQYSLDGSEWKWIVIGKQWDIKMRTEFFKNVSRSLKESSVTEHVHYAFTSMSVSFTKVHKLESQPETRFGDVFPWKDLNRKINLRSGVVCLCNEVLLCSPVLASLFIYLLFKIIFI